MIVLASVREQFPCFKIIYPLRILGKYWAGDGIHDGYSVLVLPVSQVEINNKIYIFETGDGHIIKSAERLPSGS